MTEPKYGDEMGENASFENVMEVESPKGHNEGEMSRMKSRYYFRIFKNLCEFTNDKKRWDEDLAALREFANANDPRMLNDNVLMKECIRPMRALLVCLKVREGSAKNPDHELGGELSDFTNNELKELISSTQEKVRLLLSSLDGSEDSLFEMKKIDPVALGAWEDIGRLPNRVKELFHLE